MLSLYFSYAFIPPELGRLSKVCSLVGASQKLTWHILRLFHYLVFILLATFTFKVVAAPKCIKNGNNFLSLLTTAGALDVIWLIQHIGGPVVRSLFDPDIAFYTPEDPDSSLIISLLVYRCGP